MGHSFETSVFRPSPTVRCDEATVVAACQTEKIAQPMHCENMRSRPSATLGQIGPWLLDSLACEDAFTRVYQVRPAAADWQAQGRYALKLLRESWHDQPEVISRLRQEWIVGRTISHRR